MRCNYCSSHFQPAGIDLVREDEGVCIVNITCTHCERQAGMAMVSLERQDASKISSKFLDPELTPDELDRLSVYEPITDDDVLDAHHFFAGLDSNWKKYLPQYSVVSEN